VTRDVKVAVVLAKRSPTQAFRTERCGESSSTPASSSRSR
jgi:hypothetical protein